MLNRLPVTPTYHEIFNCRNHPLHSFAKKPFGFEAIWTKDKHSHWVKVDSGQIAGFKLDCHTPALHHLFFANDIFLMGKCTVNDGFYFKEEMKMEEERIEAEKLRVKEEAQQLALIFDTIGAFKVKRKGGKGKLIFGSVTAQDLVDIIKAQLQRDVDKRIVSLPDIQET
ncbi:hypothetical protein UlMin_019905 [Ulmus minor]